MPTQEAIAKLIAARLAADVLDVPTADRKDRRPGTATACWPATPTRAIAISYRRTNDGRIHVVRPGIEQAIARGLAYAPYVDLVWCETATPDLEEARQFADGDP